MTKNRKKELFVLKKKKKLLVRMKKAQGKGVIIIATNEQRIEKKSFFV
jgi:hypothetical protein